jgi:hypothetical protein
VTSPPWVRNQVVRPLLTIIAVAVLGAALLLTAGGAPSAPAAVHPTLVTFHRSGGFAGVDDSVTVERDRRVTVRSRGGDARHKRLSKAAMRKLRTDLKAARFDQPSPQGAPSGCADCFIYTIKYDGHRVQLSEDRVPARMRPAIDRLSRLIYG